MLLFLITALTAFQGIIALLSDQATTAKWIATSGLFATVTGVVQLEISGLFDKIITHYGNVKKYPYGPPLSITRKIIDNPDRPIMTWIRNKCFFELRTGFWFIVIGTLIQVYGVWL